MGLFYMLRLKRGYRVGWEDLLRGYFSTHAMFALLNIGFIDELVEKGAVNTSDFAPQRNLDSFVLESTCQAF